MIEKILSLYDSIKDEDLEVPQSWTIVNPYKKQWNRFEFFISKFYQNNNPRDLVIGLNPGRKGCNLTGIAFTDENVLFNKLGYKAESILYPEQERTATRIYEMLDELFENYDDFFSQYFLTNVFPFGVVENNTNVKFGQIMKNKDCREFSKKFMIKTIELFEPETFICIGGQSEKFVKKEFPCSNPTYLHHPAYVFPEEKKEKYRKVFNQ